MNDLYYYSLSIFTDFFPKIIAELITAWILVGITSNFIRNPENH